MIQDWQASKHCQADDAVLVLLLPTALALAKAETEQILDQADAVLLLALLLALAEAEDADPDGLSRLPDAVLLMIQDWQASKHCQADDAVLVLLLPTALAL